jgi:ABC-type Fe3+/spermidine/putrescine transport system ATPase subunit
MATDYLSITHVAHSYGSVQALNDVSLSVPKSQILALLGASGSGKSTLLSVIAGMIRPLRGRVTVAGEDLLALPTHRRRLGMVFQDYALWPHMTVADNVAFALGRIGSRAERRERTLQALRLVGLEALARRYPGELSGGQQQRVALARAIVAEPRILLLDEPLSALDPATRVSVRQELARLLKRLNLTTILVTHDREEAFDLADQIAVLHGGRILQVGPPQAVYERPADEEVARFMGLTILRGRAVSERCFSLPQVEGYLYTRTPVGHDEVMVAVVPEHARLTTQPGANTVAGQVVSCKYSGGVYRLQLQLGEQALVAYSKERPDTARVFVELPIQALCVLPTAPPQGAITQLEVV